jgi:hypothetical protein
MTDHQQGRRAPCLLRLRRLQGYSMSRAGNEDAQVSRTTVYRRSFWPSVESCFPGNREKYRENSNKGSAVPPNGPEKQRKSGYLAEIPYSQLQGKSVRGSGKAAISNRELEKGPTAASVRFSHTFVLQLD